jgi:demethylmenaquinone methyltransferase/2-methoxy-6-polyprenyl-1,4-benzoquinol methylase
MDAARYDDEYVAQLFDRMGPTYDWVNRLSSFGFCEGWRYQCVRHAHIQPGAVVCDMMSGGGECWPYLRRRKVSKIISVDFSSVMVRRQQQRLSDKNPVVEVRQENATQTKLPAESVDCVVGAFGLKTLTDESLAAFAREIQRILKPTGRFSLFELSNAEGWLLRPVFRWYVASLIPQIGRLMLGDIDCYRMLGVYTQSFGSCKWALLPFRAAGLQAEVHRHFFGCATALVGQKVG